MRGVERGFEWLAIHLEEEVARMHGRAFLVDALVEKAADPCADLDLLRALRLADELEHDRNIAQRDRDHADFDRRAGRGRGRRLLAPTEQRERNESGEKRPAESWHVEAPDSSGRLRVSRLRPLARAIPAGRRFSP